MAWGGSLEPLDALYQFLPPHVAKPFCLRGQFAVSQDSLERCPGHDLYPRRSRKTRPRTISAVPEKAVGQYRE